MAKFFSLSISELFLRSSKFLFFILLANLFSKSIIYEYSYFTAFFSILFIFSDFGLQTHIITSLAKSNTFKTFINFVNTSFFRVFSFVIFSIPILVFYLFSTNQLYFYIFLLFLADAFFALHFSYLRAHHDSYGEAKIKFFITSIYFFTSYIAYFTHSLHVSFLFLSVFYLIFALYCSRFSKLKYLKYFLLYLNQTSLKTTVSKSLPIFIGGVATIVYLRADILMLSWLDSKTSVALYSVASRVLELSMIVPMVISILLLPKLAISTDENIKISIIKQFLIGTCVMILFFLVSNFIVNVLFKDYINSILILDILLLSVPIILANNYIFSYFIAKNMAFYYALTTLIIAFLNILANYICIPNYSYIGASWATVFTELLGFVIGIYFLIRKSSY